MATDQITIPIPDPITPLQLDSGLGHKSPPITERGENEPCVFTFFRTLRFALGNVGGAPRGEVTKILHEIDRIEEAGEPLVVSEAHRQLIAASFASIPLKSIVVDQLEPHFRAVEQAGKEQAVRDAE